MCVQQQPSFMLQKQILGKQDSKLLGKVEGEPILNEYLDFLSHGK